MENIKREEKCNAIKAHLNNAIPPPIYSHHPPPSPHAIVGGNTIKSKNYRNLKEKPVRKIQQISTIEMMAISPLHTFRCNAEFHSFPAFLSTFHSFSNYSQIFSNFPISFDFSLISQFTKIA